MTAIARLRGILARDHDAATIDQLLADVRTEHTIAAEVEQLTAQEAELEQRLTELRTRRSELNPGPSYNPQRVRAWARTAGIPCPDKGKLPQSVLANWREYQAGLRLIAPRTNQEK